MYSSYIFANMNTNFNHVTKIRIFKNLDTRKKNRSQILQQVTGKAFQAIQIKFKFPKLIGYKLLSHGCFLENKMLQFTFLPVTFSGFATRVFITREDLSTWKQVLLRNLRLQNQKTDLLTLWKGSYKKYLLCKSYDLKILKSVVFLVYW